MDLEAAEEEEKVKLLILDEPESNVNKIPSINWVSRLLSFVKVDFFINIPLMMIRW